MHSTYVRAQNVFGYFTTIAFALAAAIALTSLLTPQHPSGSVKLRNLQVVKGRPYYYSDRAEEYAFINFDLDVDLSSLFTWNTKQVFVYITAFFPPTPDRAGTEPTSQAIIWDAILASPSEPWHQNQYIYPRAKGSSSSSNSKNIGKDGKIRVPEQVGILKLDNQRPKYQISDVSGRIAGRANATLELGWNVQPWVGALTWRTSEIVGLGKMVDEASAEALQGSESFEFPTLKAKADAGAAKTVTGGEKNRGMPA